MGPRRSRSRGSPAERIVITGASSGIGRAAALAFAQRGATVVLAARSADTLAEVARACADLGGRGIAVPTDVSDEASVQALAERAVAELGEVDAWVNAAAVWSYGRFEDTPSAVFRQIVDTTLFGQVHAARAVLPHFRSQGHGVLVNVASLYGRVSSPYVSPYVTSKWGLLGFSEVLRQEVGDAPGISVCTILPGSVDTPIYHHAANYVGRQIRPLPPVVPPERVVRAIIQAVDRPRPTSVVGRTQHLGAVAHQLLPRVYDRVVGPAVHLGALRSAPAETTDGTVFAPDPASNAVDDGWRENDRRWRRRVAGTAAGVAAGVAALTAASRRTR